jgi:hypothetical protein
MFSPSEYLTNLRQLTLLNGLVTPPGQLASIPQIPKLVSNSGVPVVTAVPGVGLTGTSHECNDLIRSLALSPLAISIAGAVAGALILMHLVKKYGPAVMQWFRRNAHQFIASIKAKLKKQRTTYLLTGNQFLVMA